MTQPAPDLSHPVFVLTCARSGSTLLRLILDTHPDLGCPPETNFAHACSTLTHIWATFQGFPQGSERRVVQVRTPRGTSAIRRAIDEAVADYLARSGKLRWCDKSLDNAQYAEMLANIWPEASFICLTRHCMDVVASGIDACRWGLTGYGFSEYASKYPGNSVAAIAECWLNTTASILEFQKENAQKCYRLRYEDLVTSPEPVVADLLAFIGASPFPGITRACFEVSHEANGGADHKAWHTTNVRSDSIGNGLSVPSRNITRWLREKINRTLAELDYMQVGEDWNQHLSLDYAALCRPTDTSVHPPTNGPAANGNAATSEVGAAHIPDVTEQQLSEAAERWPHLRGRVVGVAFRFGLTDLERADWRIGGALADDNAKDGGPHVTIVGDLPVWQSILKGDANFASALRSAGLRIVGQSPAGVSGVPEEVNAIAFLLGIGAVPSRISSLARAAVKAQRDAGLLE